MLSGEGRGRDVDGEVRVQRWFAGVVSYAVQRLLSRAVDSPSVAYPVLP